MNDPDFIELCNTWRHQSFGHIDTRRLQELYNKLSQKPEFKENPFFMNLFGQFYKGIYILLNEEHYTGHFFEID